MKLAPGLAKTVLQISSVFQTLMDVVFIYFFNIKSACSHAQVDWFSFSMLLYHLITGTWPYENLKSAIEVRGAVDTGIKPAFVYRDYTMVPMFPALERLMQRCWNDKPLERPSGHDIATVLRNASFVCLYNVIPLHTAGKITCLQTGNGQLNEVRMAISQFEIMVDRVCV